jgi:hypothetical protein
MLRIGEQALQALARRREIRSRELDSLLASEHQNPILGIVGAHLLRLRFDFDRSHFQHVVDVLFNLTSDERQGPHPDVAALRLERDDPAVRPFDLPPMLKRSWALLQVESHRRGEVVPEGSLSAFIGARMWSPGPWIVSRAPRLGRTARLPGAASSVASGPVDSAIAAVYRLLGDDARTKRLFEARDIDALEKRVALSIRPTPAGKAPPPGEADISRALRIPPATLRVLLARLGQFLEDYK